MRPSLNRLFNDCTESYPRQIGDDITNGSGTKSGYTESDTEGCIDCFAGEEEDGIVHDAKAYEGDGLMECYGVQLVSGWLGDCAGFLRWR